MTRVFSRHYAHIARSPHSLASRRYGRDPPLSTASRAPTSTNSSCLHLDRDNSKRGPTFPSTRGDSTTCPSHLTRARRPALSKICMSLCPPCSIPRSSTLMLTLTIPLLYIPIFSQPQRSTTPNPPRTPSSSASRGGAALHRYAVLLSLPIPPVPAADALAQLHLCLTTPGPTSCARSSSYPPYHTHTPASQPTVPLPAAHRMRRPDLEHTQRTCTTHTSRTDLSLSSPLRYSSRSRAPPPPSLMKHPPRRTAPTSTVAHRILRPDRGRTQCTPRILA